MFKSARVDAGSAFLFLPPRLAAARFFPECQRVVRNDNRYGDQRRPDREARVLVVAAPLDGIVILGPQQVVVLVEVGVTAMDQARSGSAMPRARGTPSPQDRVDRPARVERGAAATCAVHRTDVVS
jgi:hypothetical protein